MAYVSTAGKVCFVTVARELDPAVEPGSLPDNFATCGPSPEEIADELDNTPAVVAGIRAAEPAFIVGYAAENVKDLAVTTPEGRPLVVDLSDPWKPEATGSASIRVFVASRPSYLDRIGQGPDRESSDPRSYDIRARLDDGRMVRVP